MSNKEIVTSVQCWKCSRILGIRFRDEDIIEGIYCMKCANKLIDYSNGDLDEISQCPKCHCMTKTIKNKCDKCKADKGEQDGS